MTGSQYCQLEISGGRRQCVNCGWTTTIGGPVWKICQSPNQSAVCAASGLACIHRGDKIRDDTCDLCGVKGRPFEVFGCNLHGECSLHRVHSKVSGCAACEDRAIRQEGVVSEKDAGLTSAVMSTSSPRKLIIRMGQSLGDVVCMTAAIEELHRQYPGRFLTDVRTYSPDVWSYSPRLTPIADGDPDAQVIELQNGESAYWSVHQSRQNHGHIIDGFCQDLASKLGLPHLYPNAPYGQGVQDPFVRGRIYLSVDEMSRMSIPHAKFNVQHYWLISPGGKWDTPVKVWPAEYWQAVVDHFRDRLQFVQIGMHEADDRNHFSPDLSGVIDLRGKTSTRDLIHLVHASVGCVSGITALMHLAAAVPTPEWQWRPRPCVVIAGGREPKTWAGYATHRWLDVVGALPCCANGGCWHSHVVRDSHANSESRLCERVIAGAPKCMRMIKPEDVIRAIQCYIDGND